MVFQHFKYIRQQPCHPSAQTLTFGRNLAVEINGEIAVPRRSIDRLFLCVCVLSGVGCVFPKIVSISKLVALWFRVSPSVDKKGELLYVMLHTFCLSAGLDKTGADMLINLTCPTGGGGGVV